MIRPLSSLPNLSHVSLVAATSVAIGPTVDALNACLRHAEFAEVKLLTDGQPPEGIASTIIRQPIESLESRSDYSRFMLRDLAKFVSTNHVLCIQWDGFVLNGSGWDPAFLDYDYIGAPWPQFSDGRNVGNGGFSLRSRRLLEFCSELPFDARVPEDIAICRTHRTELERKGIRFAPESVARRFSYERTVPTGGEFGFHGAYNLVKQLTPDAAVRLFRDLEPGVLSSGERREIARWAISRGRLRLAAALRRRIT